MRRMKDGNLAMAAVLSLIVGCATTTGPRVSTSALPLPPRGTIVVVDGAGGTAATTRSLEQVVRDERLPVAVVQYEWTHGWGRFISDNVDCGHLERNAEDLARYLVQLRTEQPGQLLHVMAYSAGSAVVIRAAKYLPAGTIDRTVLLAPAVAAQTDLRPLLHASRQGVDAYISRRDLWVLGFGIGIIGTTGGPYARPAGLQGFEPVIADSRDAALYATRLRHFPWMPEYNWTGHVGQHGGSHEPRFLATFILPSLLQPVR